MKLIFIHVKIKVNRKNLFKNLYMKWLITILIHNTLIALYK